MTGEEILGAIAELEPKERGALFEEIFMTYCCHADDESETVCGLSLEECEEHDEEEDEDDEDDES